MINHYEIGQRGNSKNRQYNGSDDFANHRRLH